MAKGGHTVGYAAARRPYVAPDGMDGVRADHSPSKKSTFIMELHLNLHKFT